MLTTLTAFTPVLNAGHDLSPVEFQPGLRIDPGLPPALEKHIRVVSSGRYVCENEVSHFRLTRGWLWMQEEMDLDDNGTGYKSPIGLALLHTSRLCQTVETVLACINLAGCGENDHWRNGANIHLCGAYRTSENQNGIDGNLCPPIRFGHRFPFPHQEENTPKWTPENLSAAVHLFRQFAKFPDGKMPLPLWLTWYTWNVITQLRQELVFPRFQLGINALEAFYIDQDDKKYLWDVRERVEKIVSTEGITSLTDDFWNILRQKRNDAVHRNNLPQWEKADPECYQVVYKIDQILRATLRWAFKNQNDADAALSKGQW